MTERFPFGLAVMNDNILYHALARPSQFPAPLPPLSPHKQRIPSDRPGAVQGAKRRSVPLTARTDLDTIKREGKGGRV